MIQVLKTHVWNNDDGTVDLSVMGVRENGEYCQGGASGLDRGSLEDFYSKLLEAMEKSGKASSILHTAKKA